MNSVELTEFRDDKFSGVARLFPLPNLVMFPHVVQALHIFEPRYRKMLADSLSGDRLIALATPCLRDPTPSTNSPPLEAQVCLTQVISSTCHPNGTSDILVLGLRRALIQEELPLSSGYRRARIRLLRDVFPSLAPVETQCLANELVQLSQGILAQLPGPIVKLQEIVGEAPCLGLLTDLLAYTLPLTPTKKIQLLGEVHILERARILLGFLRMAQALGTSSRKTSVISYPIAFSDN